MADTDKFVNACLRNNVGLVRQMIDSGHNVNTKDRDGWSGLVMAMCHNSIDCVTVLLSCSDIRLDNINSNNGVTGLHIACYNNNTECVRLFLAHPACTRQIVTMRDKKGRTAEMIDSNSGNQDCVRIIKEFMDKDKTNEDFRKLMERLRMGALGVEPVMLEGMTLTQIGDAIEKITAMEQTIEEGKNTLEIEHQKELDDHQRKLDSILDRHAEENNLYENFCTEKKSQKQRLQAELQERLQAAQPTQPTQPTQPHPPASLIPECPICMESMRPPLQIFNCSNGHLICSTCRPGVNMDKCHCQEKYMGRATAMEQMVRQILGII